MKDWKLVRLPSRMAHLPKNESGYVVPFFVAYVGGKPDFRIMDPTKLYKAHRFGLCWLCGGVLGAYRAFVSGPMCGINRTSSEPPSHIECAEYAVRVCPFMINPEARRREKKLPEHAEMAGIGLKRNPGVSMIWVTKQYKAMRVDNGILFSMGPADSVSFWAEGRKATSEEIMASVDSGFPLLLEIAAQDHEGAIDKLMAQKAQFIRVMKDSAI